MEVTTLEAMDDTKMFDRGLQCISESFNEGIDKLLSGVELIQSQKDPITEQTRRDAFERFAASAFDQMQRASIQSESLKKELDKRLAAAAREKRQRENSILELQKQIN